MPESPIQENSAFVSIVIPCRNEVGIVEATIRALCEQAPTDSRHNIEILVADGMSTDGTREMLERLSHGIRELRVIDNPGQIVSTGLNRAIRAARGEIIIRADAHTEYASDYVRACVRVFGETKADNVGGPWVAKGSSWTQRAVAAAFSSSFAVGRARAHNAEYAGPVDTVYLGCWPRHVFDRVGYFDEELVRNQDDEFNLRLSRAGGLIWQSPRIQSRYIPRSSLRELFQQYLQYGFWKVRVIQKHRLPASPRHLVPGTFVLFLGLLSILAPFYAQVAWLLLLLIVLYVAIVACGSLLTAKGHGWDLLPLLPAVFACFHFGYGIGFLRGLWHFFSRGPLSPSFSRLSRASSNKQHGSQTEGAQSRKRLRSRGRIAPAKPR